MSYYTPMAEKRYDFSSEKNQRLIKERGISFEEIIMAIEEGALLDIIPHPNSGKYPNQNVYIININNYVHVVPFIKKDTNSVFLKTIFPHRKLTKQYLGEVNHDI